MSRILLRADKPFFENITPEYMIGSVKNLSGANIGFRLIADGTFQFIANEKNLIIPDSHLLGKNNSYKKNVADEINQKFDIFVIPMADILKPGMINYLQNWTKLLKKIKIPVCCLGLGIGARIKNASYYDDIKTDKAVKNFINALLNNSKSVGVRCEYTFDYLKKIGINEKNIEILGCPSLYINGPNYNIRKFKASKRSSIAMNITPFAGEYNEFVNRTIKNHHNFKYFCQDYRDLKLLLYNKIWKFGVEGTGKDAPDYYKQMLDENRCVFPIDSKSWIDDLKNYDYAFGTRLHGTIAALNAKIPATLVTHDLRTVGIAKYLKIPYVTIDALKNREIEDINNEQSWDDFNKFALVNYKKMDDFFNKNGVKTEKLPNKYVEKMQKKREVPNNITQVYSKKNGLNLKNVYSHMSRMAENKSYKPPFSVKNTWFLKKAKRKLFN